MRAYKPYKTYILGLLLTLMAVPAKAGHRVLMPTVKSLQVTVNDDWLAQPVMQLDSRDVLNVSFDELSHDIHRYIYWLEPCDPDWTPTEGLFESDWLEGFNRLPLEDYEHSLNTTVLYTHYSLQLPNSQCRLRQSGNYRLHITDECHDDEDAVVVELRVVEPLMNVGIGVTTNTDIDFNLSHQQVSMTVNYNSVRVTNPSEQLQAFVMQNGREDNMKRNPQPTYTTPRGLQWEHSRNLIFEAGNEYHKFEVLDPTHTTMGLAEVFWDESERSFHAVPYPVEPRRSYLYDEDADGAFIIRNSDNMEIDYTSDYVLVHYLMKAERPYDNARLFVNGRWTTEAPETYTMTYDPVARAYRATVLQKLGYYNYQLLMADLDGTTHRVPEEGSFYQTENRYQAFIYYKGTGARCWSLVGYQEIVFRAH